MFLFSYSREKRPGERGGRMGGRMPSYSGVTYSAKSEPEPWWRNPLWQVMGLSVLQDERSTAVVVLWALPKGVRWSRSRLWWHRTSQGHPSHRKFSRNTCNLLCMLVFYWVCSWVVILFSLGCFIEVLNYRNQPGEPNIVKCISQSKSPGKTLGLVFKSLI